MPDPSSILRILMTADCVGGVWSYCMELARSASFRGMAICLATMGGPVSKHQASEALRLPNLQLLESPFKLEWMEDPWDDVARAGEWLLQMEERFAPDLIHLNGFSHGRLPFRAPKLVVGHSCVLSWWQAVRGEAAPGSWHRYRKAVAAGLRGADLVVAPSQTMLESLHHYYGGFENSRVIHNGCDAERFKPGTKEPLILSAGRAWDEAKNIAALAAIAPEIRWPIFVAGESEHPNTPRRKFMADRVAFLGHLSQAALAEWYGRASIYVSPARYEPFGLSILEAALSGCALVLGDIPSLREIWGEAALFVSADEPEPLKRAIENLIEDTSWRTALAKRARRHALQFTGERMAAAYRAAYSSLRVKQNHPTKELAACG